MSETASARYDYIRELAFKIASGESDSIENLDEKLRSLSSAELNELFTQTDFYSNAVDSKPKDGQPESVVYNESGYAVVSLTNMAERFISDKKRIAIVGFLYHSLLEYDDYYWMDKPKPALDSEEYIDVEKVLKAKKLIIKEFLDMLFCFNPEIHYNSSHWPFKDDISRHRLPNKPAMDLYAPKTVKLDMSTPPITDPSRINEIDPANVEVEDVHIPVMSSDIYQALSAYEHRNNDAIDDTVNDIYGTKSNIRFTMRLFETFPGTKEGLAAANEYRDAESRKMGISLDIIDKNKWVLMEQTKSSNARLKYDTDSVMRGILDEQARAMRTSTELMRNNIRRRKKANAKKLFASMSSSKKSSTTVHDKRTEESMQKMRKYATSSATGATLADRNYHSEDPPTLNDYQKFAGLSTGFTEEDLEIDDLDKFVKDNNIDPRTVYENVDEEGIPLNAVVMNCLVNTGDKLETKQIFVEAQNINPAQVEYNKYLNAAT